MATGTPVLGVTPPCDLFSNLHDCCQISWFTVGSGGSGFSLVKIYLPSGRDSEELRASLAHALFSSLATLPSAPTFIVGDFQQTPDANKSMLHTLSTGEWLDLHWEQQNCRGLPCLASSPKPILTLLRVVLGVPGSIVVRSTVWLYRL